MKEQYEVKRLDRPVDWTVDVPGSKSMTNRALLMAALSDGEVKLEGVLFSDDSRHFLESLVSLGFMVDINESEKAVTVLGCGGNIPKKQAVINVGGAGTAARFLTAMLGFSDGEYTIEASDAGVIFTAHQSWCKDYLSGNRRTFAGEDLWTEKSKSRRRSVKGRWNPTAVVT